MLVLLAVRFVALNTHVVAVHALHVAYIIFFLFVLIFLAFLLTLVLRILLLFSGSTDPDFIATFLFLLDLFKKPLGYDDRIFHRFGELWELAVVGKLLLGVVDYPFCKIFVQLLE